MTDHEQALKQFLSRPYPNFGACGCLGPRDGNPFCPCKMQMCEKVNDVWYLITETRANGQITHNVQVADDVLREEEEQLKVKLMTPAQLARYNYQKKRTVS